MRSKLIYQWKIFYYDRYKKELGIFYLYALNRRAASDQGALLFGKEFRVALKTGKSKEYKQNKPKIIES